jgi:hypothetical protein
MDYMYFINRHPAIYLIIFSICFYSCTWSKVKNISPDCGATVPDTISFSNNVLPLFARNCSITGCHSGTSPSGNLNLEAADAYSKLSKMGSGYIDTLNPTQSVLYSSMASVSDPMPPSGKLDDCSLEIIEKWMLQKAKNN